MNGTCSSCGASSDSGKFCNECGTALSPAQSAVAPVPVAERRVCSVLLVDLVGFTPLSESRDPEAVRELLSWYFEQARTVITRYGGAVEKFGDAVNTAARVQSAASAGRVLVDETTRRLAAAGIGFADAGEQTPEGKNGPFAVFEATRVLSVVGGAQRVDGLEAPMVGRDAKLRLIKAEVDDLITEAEAIAAMLPCPPLADRVAALSPVRSGGG